MHAQSPPGLFLAGREVAALETAIGAWAGPNSPHVRDNPPGWPAPLTGTRSSLHG
jgi:hypothetical protein